MDDLATIFSINNLPGHLSYILIAVSYWMTKIFWLRVAAVIGLSLEIVYFLLSGGDLRAGIGWDVVFIVINLYQIHRLVKDRLSLRLPEDDRELLRGVLAGLDDAQIARLLAASTFTDIPAGTVLGSKPNQRIELRWQIRFSAFQQRPGGEDERTFLVERRGVVGDRAVFTQQPAGSTAGR